MQEKLKAMEDFMYVIIGIIVIALIPKIFEDVQKGIAEGNEKKRQKDLIKEVNDSNHPNNKVCCRFCVNWTKHPESKDVFNISEMYCNSDCSEYSGENTEADKSCYHFEENGSNRETTGNNSGSTGEASRKH